MQSWRQRYSAEIARRKKELTPLMDTDRKLMAERQNLVPTLQTKNLVWVYINRTK